MLIVKDLSKTFGPGKKVLRDISFTLEPGSFTAVLGMNGAGKTTLLRCILQLVRTTQGKVWFEGCELTACGARRLNLARRSIAWVTQQHNLVARRSALENCLAGRLRELSWWRCLFNCYPRSLLLEGLSALERVQLLDAAFQRADQLSGGQQQRVAVARALTQGARLLLADEPIASLDPDSAQRVLALLRSFCREEGLTVLCNLHQIEMAVRFSDRILGLRDGIVVLDQPVGQITPIAIAQLYEPLT